MNLLLVHNYYQQPGGEDQSFAAEAALLEARGHRVVRYTLHNDAVATMGLLDLARATLWNGTVYRDLRALIRQERPHLVHFHNTFPLISPAAYYAARAEGVPVVQRLSNYRLFCLNACFYRDGAVCEACMGKALPLPGIRHGCYRDDRLASTGVATLLATHRAAGTWLRMVDLYVTLSHFARNKFIEGGLPADKLYVKPNFLDPAPPVGTGQGGYALFVGRLSPEKGLRTLLAAWRQVGERLPLRIVGAGPLQGEVEAAVASMPGVSWLGRLPAEEVYRLMGEAALLVAPSECYETFGRASMEAFATGTPVVASALGAVAELVTPGIDGFHVRPGDPDALAAQVHWIAARPELLPTMRQAARRTFATHFTAERNYRLLLHLYERVLAQRSTLAPA